MAVAARPPRFRRLRTRLRRLWARRWFRRTTVTAGVLFVLSVLMTWWAYAAVSLPEAPESAQTTIVLDAEGTPIAELFDTENRVAVALDDVAPVMRDAVVAAEDHDFYSHRGLDPFAIVRAVYANVRGKPLQGGSTITQQLVKNTWLSPERSLSRKAKEAILAVKVEREWSKDEILERYLNTVYFGRGAYGVEKAAQIWFDVSAKDLTLPQAALLAGLIRAPESADPERDMDTAVRRREIVLDAMVEIGRITAEEAEAAKAEPIAVEPRANPDERLTGHSAYFVAQVRKWLVQRYGEQVAFGGGLQVQTTLRPSMQAAAEEAVFGTLDRPDDPDAALVSVDDRGAVVAMIGGRDFQQSKVNLAMGRAGGGSGRQPGSTFKPFVLAAALEAGIPVTQRYPGPAQMTIDVEGVEYPVENYGGESFGTIDLIDATAHSVNTVYVQLMADVGVQNVADLAMDLGITTPIEPNPSIALGAAEVSPLDMAVSYTSFADRGERVTPFFVEKVTDSEGKVIYSADTRRERVLPEQFADVVNHVLQGVIESGTGRAADIGRPAAGKTGTTSDNTDAWFVGYTPEVSTAVWMGYKDGTERKMDNVRGRAVTGGSFPAQIWQQFMSVALDGLDTGDFVEPPDELLRARPAEVPSDSTTTSIDPDATTSTTTSPTSSTTSTTIEGGDGTTTTTLDGDGGDGGATSTSTSEPPATTTTAPPATTTSSPPEQGGRGDPATR